MSRYLNDSAQVPITCPKCGNKFSKTIGQLQSNTKFTCPKCGQGFNSSDFKSGIQKVEDSLRDLGRKLGK